MLSPSISSGKIMLQCRSSNSTWFLHQNATAAHDQEVSGRVAGACGMYACMPLDWLPNIALLGYTPGKLHRGYHPKRWIEDILCHVNLNLEGAMRTAQDRIH